MSPCLSCNWHTVILRSTCPHCQKVSLSPSIDIPHKMNRGPGQGWGLSRCICCMYLSTSICICPKHPNGQENVVAIWKTVQYNQPLRGGVRDPCAHGLIVQGEIIEYTRNTQFFWPRRSNYTSISNGWSSMGVKLSGLNHQYKRHIERYESSLPLPRHIAGRNIQTPAMYRKRTVIAHAKPLMLPNPAQNPGWNNRN